MAFAIYANHVTVPRDLQDAPTKIVGQALGEIAAAAYDAPQESTIARANAQSEYDVLIRNGHIVDGSGNPWYAGDVAIRGNRIVAIGKLKDARAKRVIDASGMIIAPGFIDMLGQSETSLLIDNRALSKLSQGITSEITGEGGSAAPQDGRRDRDRFDVARHDDLRDGDGHFQCRWLDGVDGARHKACR